MDKKNKLLLAKKEAALRALARKDFKTFVLLKWARYNKKPFLDNWHYDYICKILEATLPKRLRAHNSLDQIKRLILNMPPSYGKTELFARSFLAWSLGQDLSRKHIYISYSEDLCRKISDEVRELIKSPFFEQIFGVTPYFLQANASGFNLKEGGGLFVTTLKSAITGFHAHHIIIDDPIKVSAMSSKSERGFVNRNFKESVLSRLQDNDANISIIMQRLGDEDLCGFLQDPREFEQSIRSQWRIEVLQAINKDPCSYEIGDYSYKREAREALFPLRHDLNQLKELELQMGADEFSTQYLQEPQASEAGYFESVFFKYIPSYEIGDVNVYIFVDNAISLESSADNRAVLSIAVENYKDAARYIVLSCAYGVWSEEQTVSAIVEAMNAQPRAKVFIESDGGGITLARLLDRELVRINSLQKQAHKPQITNDVRVYTPSRKISKVEKIKALRPYYNTGFLVFVHNCPGAAQIQKELLSFNPQKPFRKDDCIDCIASALAHEEVLPPSNIKKNPNHAWRNEKYLRSSGTTRRTVWNI